MEDRRLSSGLLCAVLLSGLWPAGAWCAAAEIAAMPNLYVGEDPEADFRTLGTLFDGTRWRDFGLAPPEAAAVSVEGRSGGVPPVGPVVVRSRGTPLHGGEAEGAPPAPQGTLLLVQIDGLGYHALLKAIEGGYAPNLAALRDEGGWSLSPYLNGVPTVTMAVQSEIFYDRLQPGNEWYSKKRGREVTVHDEERLIAPETGLMSGGRTYMSELSGGAAEGADIMNKFEADAEKSGKFMAVLKELWVGAPLFFRYLFSRNPFSALWDLVGGMVGDARRLKRDFEANGFDRDKDKQAPLFFALTGRLWSNIAMTGLKKAAKDGAPVAYADFPTYDEYAHYYGAQSPEAFEALRRIDAQIGEVLAAAGRYGGRVLVFSDHGQTPTGNFIRTFGESPQQLLERLLKETAPGAEAGELVFSHVYSMGNIYSKAFAGRADLADLRARYPGLVEKLLAHPGIGMLAAREEGRMVLLSKGGDPLAPYVDELIPRDVLAAQIEEYLSLEESGDLVVFAPYENGRTMDYNPNYTLVSEHGGIGGGQMHPFLLFHPAQLPLEPETLRDARGIGRALRSVLRY